MTTNELRLGNYYLSYSGKYEKVDLALFNLLYVNSLEINEIGKPIFLNEEILLKFGFIKDIDINGNIFFDFENYIKTDLNILWVDNNEFIFIEMTVHRLQNINFSLKEQELNISGLI